MMQSNNTLHLLRTGQLAGTTRLDLSCGLKTFPEEIFDLADTLEVLNLTGNALSSLPPHLSKLKKLKVIFCSENQFTDLPEALGECPELTMIGFKANKINIVPDSALPKKLQWLILTDNALTHIPHSISACHPLQKLMLAGNQLTSLPDAIAACENLELIRISANQFDAIPTPLLTMPRLAWLALAGNPFNQVNEENSIKFNQLTHIDWKHLDIQQKLGEGASGIIYQATWHRDDHQPIAVAVKLFKGAVTSDGLPQSEMAACMGAGAHHNLTAVEGQLIGHPEQVQGIVMPLIHPSYQILANPPSLASCTRDVYSKDRQFDISTALNIALGIAQATQHLHDNGILHGDLYAHNILHNGLGECLLSDFGGASYLPTNQPALSATLQRIEVRAFACLLEELIDRTVQTTDDSQHTALRTLQQACHQPEVNARPLFNEISQQLTHIVGTISI
jgi:hypothetical protein